MTVYGVKQINDDIEGVTHVETDSGHIIIMPSDKFVFTIEMDGNIFILNATLR